MKHKKKRRYLTDFEQRKVARLYADGALIKTIAHQFDVCEMTVCLVAKRAGIPRRHVFGRSSVMPEKHTERNARIRELRDQGKGPTAIAQELGISLGAVAGVNFRTDRPWSRPQRLRPTAEAIRALAKRGAA